MEEILAITGRERIRWTKDGRLQGSGTGDFNRGAQRIQVAFYAFEQIKALASNPALIAEWRDRDRELQSQRMANSPMSGPRSPSASAQDRNETS